MTSLLFKERSNDCSPVNSSGSVLLKHHRLKKTARIAKLEMMIAKVVLAVMLLTVYAASGRSLDDIILNRSVRASTCMQLYELCFRDEQCCNNQPCITSISNENLFKRCGGENPRTGR
ncbi:hypothetical protein BsWGS_21388 [Bradybaena similaris]